MAKRTISREELKKLYVDQRWTVATIAKSMFVRPSDVVDLLDKYGFRKKRPVQGVKQKVVGSDFIPVVRRDQDFYGEEREIRYDILECGHKILSRRMGKKTGPVNDPGSLVRQASFYVNSANRFCKECTPQEGQ